jgi:hypothetical protein
LRKIPKKVQEFSLHLGLTGPVLGQGNGSIILVSDNPLTGRTARISPQAARPGTVVLDLALLAPGKLMTGRARSKP